ncbi:hypothetical protein JOF48_000904 [Arthrobacter stackebrandtii]|uniref:Uncharacterized protein n=1 Tax=Arthrobacter stackebrandtii TaxID=272161 RepID=A0ABS4YTG7_9MICC|nr:hypothetical protein [Arthrobacter stackebrandtii]PYH01910.1 hypothetical protein CVV67_00170 [Arthrobacter stackebrandtii]
MAAKVRPEFSAAAFPEITAAGRKTCDGAGHLGSEAEPAAAVLWAPADGGVEPAGYASQRTAATLNRQMMRWLG